RYLDNLINDLKNAKSSQRLFGYFSKISRAQKSFGKVTRNKYKSSHMIQIYSHIQRIENSILNINMLNNMSENKKSNQYKSNIINISLSFYLKFITPIAFTF